MIVTEVNIPCVWRGTLNGILIKNDRVNQKTMKFICIHGWLDNLNSLLPVAQKLVSRHSSEIYFIYKKTAIIFSSSIDYEIYLYDRAGHGFSSHIPKGFDYADVHNLRDLRTVVRS